MQHWIGIGRRRRGRTAARPRGGPAPSPSGDPFRSRQISEIKRKIDLFGAPGRPRGEAVGLLRRGGATVGQGAAGRPQPVGLLNPRLPNTRTFAEHRGVDKNAVHLVEDSIRTSVSPPVRRAGGLRPSVCPFFAAASIALRAGRAAGADPRRMGAGQHSGGGPHGAGRTARASRGGMPCGPALGRLPCGEVDCRDKPARASLPGRVCRGNAGPAREHRVRARVYRVESATSVIERRTVERYPSSVTHVEPPGAHRASGVGAWRVRSTR